MWRSVGDAARGRLPWWGRLGLMLALGTAVLAGCRQTPPVLEIGLAAPFEGQHRQVGYDVIYSARLAVRQVNAAGGIGPYRVALTALDDAGDPLRAREAAATLITDPDVIIVIGHWLTETTAAALPLYAEAGLPVLVGGAPPFDQLTPTSLPAPFVADYEAVTPFDETPGPYAGAAYDGLHLIFAALAQAAETGPPTRERVAAALATVEIDGMIGRIRAP